MRDGRSLSRRSNEQLWVMRRLGFNIKEYKWIFTRGQQGTWSNWRSNLVQIQEFIGWGCLWPCAKHEGPVTCVVEVKKKASRGVYCRPASRPGFLKHLRTWGGWPLLSGMEKNHTASKMDRQKMEKKQESMCFVVFRCQRKKGSKTFFEPFFTFCLIFFIARGNISRTTRMASGFSLGPGSLVSIHCFSSTEAPITWGGWSPIRRILEQRRMGSSPIVGSLGFEVFFFPSKHAIDILFWSSLDMLVSKKPDI